jgi:hypothetical protein
MDPLEREAAGRGEGTRIDSLLEQLHRCALEVEGRSSFELREWVDRAEAWRIVKALRECRGNRSAAARVLWPLRSPAARCARFARALATPLACSSLRALRACSGHSARLRLAARASRLLWVPACGGAGRVVRVLLARAAGAWEVGDRGVRRRERGGAGRTGVERVLQ